MRAKKTFAKAACAILATAAIAVPAALRAEDAYIESDGTSGIDIGYKLKDNSRIEVDFKIAAENGATAGCLVQMMAIAPKENP